MNKNSILFKYQQTCVDFIKDNFGLILYFSMGSGKTLTSLMMMKQFNKPLIIITTKASKKNFNDDIKKFNINIKNITIITYQKIIKKIATSEISFNDKCVIIDEAHRLRNATKLLNFIITETKNAYRLALLTGTVFYNELADLSVLVNMIKKEEILPDSNKEFKFFYYDEIYETPTNIDVFRQKIKNTICYFKKALDENYPKSELHIIKVDMDNNQISEYRNYVRKILSLDTLHIDFSNYEQKKVNYFLNITRQLSNTTNNSFDSPKIQQIFNYIQNKPKPCIIYSNYLDNGVLPIANLLNKHNIKYGIFHGEQSDDKRDKIINNYNDGLLDVLLITSAGSESLDLKNTRQIHIMEPNWNESKINQIIGRSIRYKSHEKLPLNQRLVSIYRWISVFGYKLEKIETADEYLLRMAEKKEKMFKQFDDIIKITSI
jgi:superfamily II DNA or RNA helicase